MLRENILLLLFLSLHARSYDEILVVVCCSTISSLSVAWPYSCIYVYTMKFFQHLYTPPCSPCKLWIDTILFVFVKRMMIQRQKEKKEEKNSWKSIKSMLNVLQFSSFRCFREFKCVLNNSRAEIFPPFSNYNFFAVVLCFIREI